MKLQQSLPVVFLPRMHVFFNMRHFIELVCLHVHSVRGVMMPVNVVFSVCEAVSATCTLDTGVINY
jgi:hypothetical protein